MLRPVQKKDMNSEVSLTAEVPTLQRISRESMLPGVALILGNVILSYCEESVSFTEICEILRGIPLRMTDYPKRVPRI